MTSADCWLRGTLTGALTPRGLSSQITDVIRARLDPDARCRLHGEARGFVLRIFSVDEGFESDEDAACSPLNASYDETFTASRLCYKLDMKSSIEDSSSSANSSCSENDESASSQSLASSTSGNLIDGSDIVFCHSDPTVPCYIALIVRKWTTDRSNSLLELLILKYVSEVAAKNILNRYHEYTRHRRWQRYNILRKQSTSSDEIIDRDSLISCSSKNTITPLRLGNDLVENGSNLLEKKYMNKSFARQNKSMFDKASHVEVLSEFSDDVFVPATCTKVVTNHVTKSNIENNSKNSDQKLVHTTSAHKQPKQQNVVLVPTKSGLGPYRVIRGADFARPPAPMMHVELPPSWPNICQFDANNNKNSQHAPRIVWTPVRMVREKSPARSHTHRKTNFRSGSLDLPTVIGNALREIGEAVSSHLRRHDNHSDDCAPRGTDSAPKSVMKKNTESGSQVDGKRVTFSAFSTLQVME